MCRLLTALVFAVCCTGCFGPAPSAQFVQEAQRLHDGALTSAVTLNADLRDYVQLVGKRIIAAAHAAEPAASHDPFFSQMQFHLVACEVPNVFVTGGPHIYVYNGLLQRCRTEDELAGAIAHAYAHTLRLDVEHTGIEPDPARPLPRVAWDFVTHRFTLGQEQAADGLAFELCNRAGYDLTKLAALFERLAAEFPEAQSPDRQPLALRAQGARQAAASRGRRPLPVADPRTFEGLRRQAASLNPRLAGPEAQLFLRAFPNCLLSGDTRAQQAAQQQLKPPPPPPTRLEPS